MTAFINKGTYAPQGDGTARKRKLARDRQSYTLSSFILPRSSYYRYPAAMHGQRRLLRTRGTATEAPMFLLPNLWMVTNLVRLLGVAVVFGTSAVTADTALAPDQHRWVREDE